MPYFDLRFVLVLIVNLMKSYAATTWEWDPFHVASDLTWIKFWLLSVLFFVFSFVSIRIPSTSPNISMGYIQVQIKNFSSSLLICFLASIFFPQSLFWYAYPAISLLFLCDTYIANMLRSFVFWVQAAVFTLPDIDIFVIPANTVEADNLEEVGEQV